MTSDELLHLFESMPVEQQREFRRAILARSAVVGHRRRRELIDERNRAIMDSRARRPRPETLEGWRLVLQDVVLDRPDLVRGYRGQLMTVGALRLGFRRWANRVCSPQTGQTTAAAITKVSKSRRRA